MLVEVVASFGLAILSWRFVERPFRKGVLKLSGQPLFAAAGVTMAAFIGISLWTMSAHGFAGRFPADAVRVASSLNDVAEDQSMRTGSCFITTDYRFDKYNYDLCLKQDKNKKNYLLLGDSHSAMLWSALANELKDANVMQANTNACPPVLHPTGSADCKKMMDFIFEKYLPAHPVQALFLVGRWQPQDLTELTKTIEWAKQRKIPVTVFGPMPEYDGPLPRLLAYSIAWNKPDLPMHHLVNTTGPLDVQMQAMAETVWHVPYISLYKTICQSERCLEYADTTEKIPLMSDTNHLNQYGASLVVQRLVHEGELN